jgi:hypothetical protein
MAKSEERLMNTPLVFLPDSRTLRLTRPFEKGSMQYWQSVHDIMRMIGSSREDTEQFVSQQRACVLAEDKT